MKGGFMELFNEFISSPYFILARDLIAAFCSVAMYSLLMQSPKRTLMVSAASAAIGYVIYDAVMIFLKQEFLAYFCGTLFIAAFGEIMARVYKAPATIFIFPGIIPLVPGIGIYKTMFAIVNNRFDEAMNFGTRALLSAGVMAVAIALTNLSARYIFPKKSVDRDK